MLCWQLLYAAAAARALCAAREGGKEWAHSPNAVYGMPSCGREGTGERDEWNDPEIQARFKQARERAAARRRKKALEKEHQQSRDKVPDASRRPQHGGRRLAHALAHAPAARRRLALSDTPKSSGKGDLCFVEGGVQGGAEGDMPAPLPAPLSAPLPAGASGSWQRWSLFNVTRDAAACLVARELFSSPLPRCLSHADCLSQVPLSHPCTAPRYATGGH